MSVVVVSLCSEGRWRCTEADCDAEILCPGELTYRTDLSDCTSTCDGLDSCNADAPLRSGCGCPDGLVLHPDVRYLLISQCSFAVFSCVFFSSVTDRAGRTTHRALGKFMQHPHPPPSRPSSSSLLLPFLLSFSLSSLFSLPLPVHSLSLIHI